MDKLYVNNISGSMKFRIDSYLLHPVEFLFCLGGIFGAVRECCRI